MRLAWNEALKRHDDWDFYLLINDDTDLFDDCFEELVDTHVYCFQKTERLVFTLVLLVLRQIIKRQLMAEM